MYDIKHPNTVRKNMMGKSWPVHLQQQQIPLRVPSSRTRGIFLLKSTRNHVLVHVFDRYCTT